MQGRQSLCLRLRGRIQRVKGRVHAGKEGVAPFGRGFDAIEHRGPRGYLKMHVIRVPFEVVRAICRRKAHDLPIDIAHHKDLRMTVEAG